MFSSLADAQNYALGVAEGEEAKDARKLGGTSFIAAIGCYFAINIISSVVAMIM